MNNQSVISRSGSKLVVGLGKTGLAVVDYLKKQGFAVKVADTRKEPPNLARFKEKWPDIPLALGSIPESWCLEVDEIIVSPGLPANMEVFELARSKGVSVIGDISLFLRVCEAPIIAVTGSNGKSTLVDLLGFIARGLGIQAQVLGNIGVPAITAVNTLEDLVILELSSFQLELIESLNAKVAMVLNVTPDHMDRYQNLQDYWLAKQRIYQGAEIAIINRDDTLSIPNAFTGKHAIRYGVGSPDTHDFGVLELDAKQYLAHGVTPLLPAEALRIKGKHNLANALAALAVAEALDWPLASVTQLLTRYPGLAYRCQWVGEKDDVQWYNDSKATNVGATIAAIEGLHQDNKALIWIAGGDAKGAEFSALASVVRQWVTRTYLFGRDRDNIGAALTQQGYHQWQAFDTLAAVIAAIKDELQPGSSILFSPACASFDQYDGFEQRGKAFDQLIQPFL